MTDFRLQHSELLIGNSTETKSTKLFEEAYNLGAKAKEIVEEHPILVGTAALAATAAVAYMTRGRWLGRAATRELLADTALGTTGQGTKSALTSALTIGVDVGDKSTAKIGSACLTSLGTAERSAPALTKPQFEELLRTIASGEKAGVMLPRGIDKSVAKISSEVGLSEPKKSAARLSRQQFEEVIKNLVEQRTALGRRWTSYEKPMKGYDHSVGHNEHHMTVRTLPQGQFLLENEIGRGGSGVVYRALDQRLNRSVAIKIMHGYSVWKSAHRRFESEIKTLADIDSVFFPHIYKGGKTPNNEFFNNVRKRISAAGIAYLIRNAGHKSLLDLSPRALRG